MHIMLSVNGTHPPFGENTLTIIFTAARKEVICCF